MKKLALIFFSFFSIITFSQNEFKGTVTDENTALPIPSVQIYVVELKVNIETNFQGQFEITAPDFTYLTLIVEKAGYEKISRKIQSALPAEIALVKSDIELDEVIVSGSANKSIEKVPFPVESISNEELQQSGGISLAQNISKIPGVNYSSLGSGVSKPVIRGLTNTNIVFLNDGVKVENFQFSSSHPFLADEFSAKKIEVIKGPFSLTYGSDAVGGVINVIKKTPAPLHSIQIDFDNQYHSNTQGFVNHLGIKSSGAKFYGGMSMTNKSHKDYKDGNGNQVINSRFNELNMGLNAGFRGKKALFELSYDYTLPQYGLTTQKSLAAVADNQRTLKYWYQDLENHLISSKNKFFINDNILFLDVSYQQNIRQGVSDSSNSKPEMIFASMKLQTLSYNLKYQINQSKSRTYVGINGDFINNDADDDYGNSNPMTDAKIFDIGTYLIYEYDLTDQLNWVSGLRYDFRNMKSFPYQSDGLNKNKIDNDYNSLTGSTGITYRIKKHLFKMNVASGYRSPNISELTQNGMHSNRFERGDVNLVPQRNYQFDLNYHFHTKQLMIDVSPFYNMVNNYIYIVKTDELATLGGGYVWQYVQNDADLYGGEVAVDYHPLKWLGLHTNYTFTKGVLKEGGYLTQIPQNKWVGEAKFHLEKWSVFKQPYLLINYSIHQAQNDLGAQETYSPQYELLNISIGSILKIGQQQIKWYISGNNVLNEVYIDHLSLLKSLNVNNMGRNIVFGLSIPIISYFK